MRARVLLLLGFLCVPVFPGDADGQLRREMSVLVGQKKFAGAMWGIKVVSLDSGAVLFETNAQKLLKPASNAKLFTGALALDALGPEYRIRTSLLAKAAPDASGTLRGDLVVYGRGDPSFAARFQEGSYTNLLGRMVAAVRGAGVRRIKGDLVGDETFFSGPRFGASWTWDDLQNYYGAEVSALTVQDNVVDLFVRPGAKAGARCVLETAPKGIGEGVLEFVNRTRTTETNGGAAITIYRPPGERRVWVSGTLPRNHRVYVDAVTVPNPARWFVMMLREALEREGISVAGQSRVRSWPGDARLELSEWKEIGFTVSPPAGEIVATMLKASQNLYAQLLFLQSGAKSGGWRLTEDAGVRVLRTFAQRAGLDPNEVLLDEGSGLSRTALVTPNALAGLLGFMTKHPHAKEFREALPVPGEGTLRTRFRDWRGEAGRAVELRAKTGTIQYVSTLCGYMRSGAGEQLAFAVMLNGYEGGSASAREAVEAVVRLLAKAGKE